MAGIFRFSNAVVKLLLVEPFFYQAGDTGFADGPRYGIEDENEIFLIHCAKFISAWFVRTKIRIIGYILGGYG